VSSRFRPQGFVTWEKVVRSNDGPVRDLLGDVRVLVKRLGELTQRARAKRANHESKVLFVSGVHPQVKLCSVDIASVGG